MEIAIPPAKHAPGGTELLQRWVESWIGACSLFRRWEREELILKRPSHETLAEHSNAIKRLIWTARMLQAMMADPDCPAREFRREIDGLLRQLEETSEMIHNPMSDEECDALLKKYFPDEPGTGSTA